MTRLKADGADARAVALLAGLMMLAAGAGPSAARPLKVSVPAASAPEAAPCADFSFPIYFRAKSDRLTAPAREAINQSAVFASDCPISNIKVVGLDAEGPELSRKRADAVSRALAEGGFPPTDHGILAAEPNRDALLGRKAEVFVRFVKPRS